MEFLKYICILGVTLTIVIAQENAQTRIPNSLMECYEDPRLLQRDYRIPNTLSNFLDLIRKVENDPTGKNMDMRTMSVSLLHRFRLDGIVKASKIAASSNVVPFSPQGFQFYRHRILLANLIPGNAMNFPNASMTSLERCSFHHMISDTIEEEARGDEGSVCIKLSQFRTQRLPRSTRRIKRLRRQSDVEETPTKETDVEVDITPGVYANDATEPVRSQCPVETGVIHTIWGAISAGTLLAGIAAGLQPQNVALRDLSDRLDPEVAKNTVAVDNRFAATLSGDLAEAALRQGPSKDRNAQGVINIGAPGGWNTTTMPKWYFLFQSSDYEYTDAEIRGGLDGLILATNIRDLQSKASGMKLSQLIEMYYSPRGVFSDKIRACNRKSLLTEVAPTETLKSQTLGFSLVLDRIMQLQATITPKGFSEYSSLATDSLLQYIPRSLNDLSCTAVATSAINFDVQAVTDLVIALDSSWTFNIISPAISYILDHMNLSPLGSNITLMSAKDGSIVLNYTSSLSTFHEKYNLTVHQSLPDGFEVPKVLDRIKEISFEKLNREKRISWSGGQAQVVLMVINTMNIPDNELKFATEQLKLISEEIPDLRFLYLVSGGRERFTSLVKEPEKDIFTYSTSTESIASELNKVIGRIKEIQRRLINPRCGADWLNQDGGRNSLVEYVAPTMINYYRLHPNYFYVDKDQRMLSIQGHGFGSVNVCYSRTVPLPRRSNNTAQNEGVECQSLTSNKIDIDLAKACTSQTHIHRCDPLYVSVEGVSLAGNPRCSEPGCHYPDNIKYTFNMQELGCYSGGSRLISNIFVFAVSIIFMIKKLFES